MKNLTIEKFNQIDARIKELNKIKKTDLLKIADAKSRISTNMIRTEDKYTIRNFILSFEFGTSELRGYDQFNQKGADQK